MGRVGAGFCWLVLLWLAAGAAAGDGVPGTTAQPQVDDLGGGRYRIGAITLDKPKGEFSLPGTVIELQSPNSPIEFIAVTKGGFKRYEAIFELDTTAVNFNLACIMIGLDASHSTSSSFHFDPKPLAGDRVDVFVSWEEAGKTRSVPVGEVLRRAIPTPGPDEWVYTGSTFAPNGDYMAESSGTLIGFVHDPDSIIQHRQGLGLGHYGAITYNPDVLPPAGTPVRVEIIRSKP
jgi:hypothetical protein